MLKSSSISSFSSVTTLQVKAVGAVRHCGRLSANEVDLFLCSLHRAISGTDNITVRSPAAVMGQREGIQSDLTFSCTGVWLIYLFSYTFSICEFTQHWVSLIGFHPKTISVNTFSKIFVLWVPAPLKIRQHIVFLFIVTPQTALSLLF